MYTSLVLRFAMMYLIQLIYTLQSTEVQIHCLTSSVEMYMGCS